MGPYGSLLVLIVLHASFRVLMCPYRTLCVLMDFNVSLCVFIRLYGF